ncbi:Nucleotidyltransferase domain protein [compost metagenome]
MELDPFYSQIDLAFVFGSVARGTERVDSDLDLMVVGTMDVLELGSATQKISDAVGRTVDLNLHSPEEWQRLQDDRVVRSILEGERILVIERSDRVSGLRG